MNGRTLLPLFCLLILVSLLAAPALAATTPCPDSCSCLLPAEAKKGGYSAHCSGKQSVCGYDSAKHEKYCYEKAVAVKVTPSSAPQLAVPLIHPVLTTTTTPVNTQGTTPTPVAPRVVVPVEQPDPTTKPAGTPVSPTTLPSGAEPGPEPASDGLPPDVTQRASDGAPAPVSPRPADGSGPEPGAAPSPGPGTGVLSTLGSFFASLLGGNPAVQSSSLQPVPCNGIMTTLLTDPHNCGSCGNECSSGSCRAGRCVMLATSCGPGGVPCDGACTAILSDESNCGACGRSCPSGEYCCAGTCTSIQTTENCGACKNSCERGQSCCSGRCADTVSDRLNCGGCGHECPGSSVCENEVCIDKTCEEALFLARKENNELRARLQMLNERYSELEHRFNYCLWLEDYYKGGYTACCGSHCTYPPEPTDDVPLVTGFE